MQKYLPSQTPDPVTWLDLEESQRVALVRQFHAQASEQLPEGSENIHATIHVIVENQIAMGVAPVAATISKLIRQGLTRHEAIHAVGAVLSEDIFDLLKGNIKSFNPRSYRRRLEKLTAKRWQKGRW